MRFTQFLFVSLFTLLSFSTYSASNEYIYQKTIKASMEHVHDQLYHALEQRKFWVVFEANIGENLKRFSKPWGNAYNQNQLEGYQSLVVCNGWYANQVSNADLSALALCPLRINIIHKKGLSTILFARPSVFVQNSPALTIIKEVEAIIIKAIDSVDKNNNQS